MVANTCYLPTLLSKTPHEHTLQAMAHPGSRPETRRSRLGQGVQQDLQAPQDLPQQRQGRGLGQQQRRNGNTMAPPPPPPVPQGGSIANNTNARNALITHPGTPYNTLLHSQQGSTGTIMEETQQPSLGFSQAFAMGVSIATSKFNTEAFGSLNVHELPTLTTPTGTVVIPTAIAAVTHPYDQDDGFGDDFELPGDYEDDIVLTKVAVETAMSQTGPYLGDIQPPTSQGGSGEPEDTSMCEVAMLKQRLAEVIIRVASVDGIHESMLLWTDVLSKC